MKPDYKESAHMNKKINIEMNKNGGEIRRW